MDTRALSIRGAWEFHPVLRSDTRGVFLESFKADIFESAVGRPFDLRQMNMSVSRRGTVRGIHYADVPPGQAKYVQCFEGKILDVVVDIRVGSPTFGQWDAAELDAESRTGLFITEGLGHAFCALTDSVTVGYLCSTPYSPTREHGIHPLDPALDFPWPDLSEIVLSDKDKAAPLLADAADMGMLPSMERCQEWEVSQQLH